MDLRHLCGAVVVTDVSKFMTPEEKKMNNFLKREREKNEHWKHINDLIVYYRSIGKNDKTICEHCGITQKVLDLW